MWETDPPAVWEARAQAIEELRDRYLNERGSGGAASTIATLLFRELIEWVRGGKRVGGHHALSRPDIVEIIGDGELVGKGVTRLGKNLETFGCFEGDSRQPEDPRPLLQKPVLSWVEEIRFYGPTRPKRASNPEANEPEDRLLWLDVRFRKVPTDQSDEQNPLGHDRIIVGVGLSIYEEALTNSEERKSVIRKTLEQSASGLASLARELGGGEVVPSIRVSDVPDVGPPRGAMLGRATLSLAQPISESRLRYYIASSEDGAHVSDIFAATYFAPESMLAERILDGVNGSRYPRTQVAASEWSLVIRPGVELNIAFFPHEVKCLLTAKAAIFHHAIIEFPIIDFLRFLAGPPRPPTF